MLIGALLRTNYWNDASTENQKKKDNFNCSFKSYNSHKHDDRRNNNVGEYWPYINDKGGRGINKYKKHLKIRRNDIYKIMAGIPGDKAKKTLTWKRDTLAN